MDNSKSKELRSEHQRIAGDAYILIDGESYVHKGVYAYKTEDEEVALKAIKEDKKSTVPFFGA